MLLAGVRIAPPLRSHRGPTFALLACRAAATDSPPPPPQTYVLKLARSGEDGDKVLLLVESGVRLHTIQARASLLLSPCCQAPRLPCSLPR